MILIWNMLKIYVLLYYCKKLKVLVFQRCWKHIFSLWIRWKQVHIPWTWWFFFFFSLSLSSCLSPCNSQDHEQSFDTIADIGEIKRPHYSRKAHYPFRSWFWCTSCLSITFRILLNVWKGWDVIDWIGFYPGDTLSNIKILSWMQIAQRFRKG